MDEKYESFGLAGQVALVTGASQGIGRIFAVGLAEAGCDVALVSRTVSKLEEVAADVEATGRKALVVPTDLNDLGQIRSMTEKVHETFGQIDVLVNNAAWTDTVPALEVTEQEWDTTLGTSLKGLFFTSQAVAPIMIGAGRSHCWMILIIEESR